MSRSIGIALSLAIVVLILGSSHYYIWARLVRDVGLVAPWRGLATALIVVLAFSVPLALFLPRLGLLKVPAGAGIMRVWLYVSYCWAGTFFILLCLLLVSDVLRLGLFVGWRFFPELMTHDPARRQLFLRLIGGGVAASAVGAVGAALHVVAQGPIVSRVPVTLARLPAALTGLTIAQISDLHVATLLGEAYVTEVVKRTNALSPDLVVITGDLVDGSVEQLGAAVAPLAQLRAPHGVYFVTGNHEYYSGVDPWLDELRRLGIRPLRNERVSIGVGAASFDLAGIDDFTARGFGNGHGADLKRAVAGRDPLRELVLLAHQPKAIYEAAEHGVGLMLSGHTHAGQIWPFRYLVQLAQPYLEGLHQHGPTQIYVNRGTGYWGPPMRLGAVPELTLLELRSA